MFKTPLAQLRLDMTCCDQTKGMTILQHGESVAAYYKDFISHLRYGTDLEYDWRMPSWVDQIDLDKLLPDDIMETYHVYHDCGKPYCVQYDEQGRKHFPDHAEVSKRIWSQYNSDPQIAKLIGMDMDIHLLKAVGVEEFASRPEAISLLLTGLAEVHSNAAMFGGISSTSFKIKFKQIEKRGKKILNLINGEVK